MDTIRSNLQNSVSGSILKKSEDGERWREIVETAKALMGYKS